MNSRQRVLTAVSRREPDRVPIDIGGTDVSTIWADPYVGVCERLGLDPRPITVPYPSSPAVMVNNDFIAALEVDVRLVPLLPRQWRALTYPDGIEVRIPKFFASEPGPNGTEVIRDHLGRVVAASPKEGFVFDRVFHPLAKITSAREIDQATAEIEAFDRPGYSDLPLEELGDHARELRRTTDSALVGGFVGHVFQAAQCLRGWSEFMMDLLARPAQAEALLDRIVEAHIRAFDRYIAHLGDSLDIIEICDDLGMQNAMWMRPEMYRRRVKPYQERLYRHIKNSCDAKLMLHSDGSIYPVIADLIEIGVDILNPVQFSAADMDLARLKREFGADVCLWGGSVDSQTTLTFGTPDQVRDEVRRHLDIMAPGGGYVFATVHNVTRGMPADNVLAAYQTALEYGGY